MNSVQKEIKEEFEVYMAHTYGESYTATLPANQINNLKQMFLHGITFVTSQLDTLQSADKFKEQVRNISVNCLRERIQFI